LIIVIAALTPQRETKSTWFSFSNSVMETEAVVVQDNGTAQRMNVRRAANGLRLSLQERHTACPQRTIEAR
jgi:hypothetical protein